MRSAISSLLHQLPLIVLLLLPAHPLSAQWIEDRIMLPDSFSGFHSPLAVLHNPVNNTLLVGGNRGRFITIVDGATDEKVGRIDVRGDVNALCYEASSRRIFAAVYNPAARSDSVIVIDAGTNTRVTALPVPAMSKLLCAGSGRVYSAGRDSPQLTIIDAARGEIVRTLYLAAGITGFCYNPVMARLYCAGVVERFMPVIDGRGDSLLKVLPYTCIPPIMSFNPANNRLYYNQPTNAVTVLDCASDSVDTTLSDVVGPLACNPGANKVYCRDATSETLLAVIDGTTSRITRRITIDSAGTDLLYLPDADRLYCAGRRIAVVDCAGDSLLGLMPAARSVGLTLNPRSQKLYANTYWPVRMAVYDLVRNEERTGLQFCHHAGLLCYGARRNRLFCVADDESRMLAIDGATNEVLATIPIERDHWSLCYNSVNDKLYCSTEGDSAITIVSGESLKVVPGLNLPGRLNRMCYDPAFNQLYCSDYDRGGVRVFDGASDSALGAIPLDFGLRAITCNSAGTRLYVTAAGRDSVYVLDPIGRTLQSVIPTQCGHQELCFSPPHDRLYGSGIREGEGVTVIDCAAESVVATIELPWPARWFRYDPATDRLLALCSDDLLGYVAVIDASRDSIITLLPLGGSQYDDGFFALDTASSRLYCAGDGGTVTIVDVRAARVTSMLFLAAEPAALAWNPLRRRVYASEGINSSIAVLWDGTGIEEDAPSVTSNADLLVWPNPCRGVLNIRQSVSDSRSGIRVSDALGRTRHYPPGRRQLDLSGLPDGVYFLSAGPNSTVTTKVVLRR